ncbi:MAG: ArsR/SmtB family transcription factor [Gemmatimonadaceae bacterium]
MPEQALGSAHETAVRDTGDDATGTRRRRRKADVCDVQCVDELKVRRARRTMPAAESIVTLAATLRALGDPTRLRLATALAATELCVCDLATLLGTSQSVVSHSLRTLRQLRIVRYRKEGKVAYYSLDDPHVAALLAIGLDHVEEGHQ